MILERLPNVVALSTEQKELLAEELLGQVALEKDSDPELLDRLRQRLADHQENPEAGISWETLRDRLRRGDA